ncbi:MAG: GHKL domain-containing protein [Clostridia bacterium]|nr:GHKL domain-containing protein [Clostridia bacterium]
MDNFISLFENSRLAYIAACFFAILILTAGCIISEKILFNAKISTKIYLYGICTAICAAGAAVRVFLPYDIAVSVIMCVTPYICVLLVTKNKYRIKALLSGFIYSSLCEITQYILLMFFFDYENSIDSKYLNFSVEVAAEILFFIIAVCLLPVCERKRENTQFFEKVNSTLIILVLFTMIFFIVSMVILGMNYARQKGEFIITLFNIPMIGVTSVYAAKTLIKTKLSEENYRKQLDMQVHYYEQMDLKNEELRQFRHDFPKKMRPMLMYINEGKTSQAIEIAEGFCERVEALRPRFQTGNYRLDTVLECEQQLAQKDGIKLIFPFGCSFPSDGIDPDDIYTIFPNALDNAIESCRNCENREITVVSRIVSDRVFVTVSNPVSGKLNIKNGNLITSKRDSINHGYGMKSIKKAAAKYGGSCEYSVNDGIFTLNFSLQIKQPCPTAFSV